MMLSDFHLGFDPGSLEKITKLEGFAALLNPQIQDALTQVGQLLVTTAQTNTWTVFANPTGALASEIYFYVVSPTEVDVVAGIIYSRRQELGGGGFLDSLGRPMTNPAKPYLAPAVETDKPMIEMLMETAVYNAWGEV
jgi:hypothetical protein